MFSEIFSFELKSWLRNKTTYIFFLILFLVGVWQAHLYGTVINGRVMISGTLLDSPQAINSLMTKFSYFGLFVVAMVMGLSVYKDYLYNTYSITFSSANSKLNYLLGRFLGALTISLAILIGPYLGFMISVELPHLTLNLGGSKALAYLSTYLTKTFPLVFFMGGLFFMLSAVLRNTVFNWLVVLLIYGIHLFLLEIYRDDDLVYLHRSVALLDPLGLIPDYITTKGWTTPEKNELYVPITSILLYNRMLWMGIGIVSFFITYLKIDNHFNHKFRFFGFFKRKKHLSINTKPFSLSDIGLSKFVQEFSGRYLVRLWWSLSVKNIRRILLNPFFVLFLVVAWFYLNYSTRTIGDSYPFSYLVGAIITQKAHLWILLAIIWFAGEQITRDRKFGVHEIIDTYPVPDSISLLSKYTALCIIPIAFLALILFVSINIQQKLNFEDYKIDFYLFHLYGVNFVNYLLFIPLALLTYTLVNHKYLSILLLFIYYYVDKNYSGLISNEHILFYGHGPYVPYSELNLYGEGLYPYFLFKFYWLSFSAIILWVAHRMWIRGTDSRFKGRIKTLFSKPSKLMLRFGIAFAGIFLVLATFIYYNIYGLGNHNSFNTNEARVDYELKYKKYEESPQPKITDIELALDIYPEAGELNVEGKYTMINRTETPVNQILVSKNFRFEESSIKFNRDSEELIHDPKISLSIFKLTDPLVPGDSIEMEFSYFLPKRGFENHYNASGRVRPISNGTFLAIRYILPRLGYNDDWELKVNELREHYGLPEITDWVPSISDSSAIHRNFFTSDSDLVNFKAVVSTSSDQQVIVPGNLKRKWEEGGRNYFRFETDKPIHKFVSFLSGRYEVKKEHWKEVDLEIYYHHEHQYNLDKMMLSLKKSMDYFSSNFSEYHYDQMRIIEFPRIYGSFAQSFPNTVPYSEAAGFTSDLRKLYDNSKDESTPFTFKKKHQDNPFFITAHEVAHQWWGGQILPADIEGYNVLSESLAQYSALMVVEKEYGRERVREYLKNNLKSYLRAHGNDVNGERTLRKAIAGYLTYSKGAIVLYGLRNYIGEKALNESLKSFISDNKDNYPPYPHTGILIDYIKRGTPDSLQYLVDEWFDDIILYDNEVVSAVYERTEDFDYIVECELDFKKYHSDEWGEEERIPFNDYVDVAVTNSLGRIQYVKRLKVTDGKLRFTTTVDRKPSKVIVDPYLSLIDKDYKNNEYQIQRKLQSNE